MHTIILELLDVLIEVLSFNLLKLLIYVTHLMNSRVNTMAPEMEMSVSLSVHHFQLFDVLP